MEALSYLINMVEIILQEIEIIFRDNDIDFDKADLTKDMQLIGGKSQLDSMGLVALCLRLEEISEEEGFEFDWTSANAMSSSTSFLRNVSTLAEEYLHQKGSS